MWNAQAAELFNAWYSTPQGAFALEREYELFQYLVSPWPRRGYSLLDVGCGAGAFLEMLWRYGFDVSGFDSSLELLDMSRERMGCRADFHLGKPDLLPFEDDSFDYVALLSILGYMDDPEAVLCEALRVARQGVLIGFMNSWSVERLSRGVPWPCRRDNPCGGRWMSFWPVYRMARRLCPQGHMQIRSALCGPCSTWKETRLGLFVNRLRLSLPLGAYVGIRIDKQPPIPMTPLFLQTKYEPCGCAT